MKTKLWEDNSVQFPRLIAEIIANVNISKQEWNDLCASMDLTTMELNELFDRADAEWERLKKKNCPIKEKTWRIKL